VRRRWAELGSGLAYGVRGQLGKELRSRSRGWRPVWVLTVYLGLLTLVVAGFLGLSGQASGIISPSLGTSLFSALAVGAVLLLAFITPALTAGAISGERERRTLDLLLVTRASALGLASGKLFGSLFYILFLLVAALPAFALVYLFGGVPPIYVAMVLAVAAVTALAHAALGLLLSAVLKRTLVASVAAYLIVLALVFGLPIAGAVQGASARAEQAVAISAAGPAPRPPFAVGTTAPPADVAFPPAPYLYASPLLSLMSMLPGGGSSVGAMVLSGVAGGSYYLSGGPPPPPSAAASLGLHSLYTTGRDPATGQAEQVRAWAPWVYHFAFSALFTVLCLVGAAVALAPVKPWVAWRARRRQPALGAEA